MNNNPTPNLSDIEPFYGLSTKKFANLNQVVAQTVLKRYSQTGSYFGVRPKKLQNGRLDWPISKVEA